MSTNYINQIKDSSNTTQYLADGTDTRIFTGTCETTGNDSLKLVVLDDPTNFSYTNGVKILVTFKYANTCNNDYLAIRITNVTPVSTLSLYVGNYDDYNADMDLWADNESVLLTFYEDGWVASDGMSGCITFAIDKSKSDTKVRQGFVTPGASSESGKAYPVLFSGTSGISSTSSRGSITANLNNGLRYTPYYDVLITEKLSTTNNIPDLFKVTKVSKSVGAVSAHSLVSASNWTLPNGSSPGSGYKLVAIVGWQTSNAKIYAHTRRIVDDSTIFCGFSNTSATDVSSCTYYFYLLWAKVSTISFPSS